MPEEPQSQPAPQPQNPPVFMPPAAVPQQPIVAPTPINTVQSPTEGATTFTNDVPQPQATTPQADIASQQPSTSADKVWISKEEYQRLQQAESTAAVSGSIAKPEKLFGSLQIVTSVTEAIALILGLMWQSTYYSTFLVAPALIILALTGMFTWIDYTQASKAGGYVKRHKGRNIFLLVCSILILALPVLMPLVMILIFMIVCASGGCKGS
jgi:hypothetical protein